MFVVGNAQKLVFCTTANTHSTTLIKREKRMDQSLKINLWHQYIQRQRKSEKQEVVDEQTQNLVEDKPTGGARKRAASDDHVTFQKHQAKSKNAVSSSSARKNDNSFIKNNGIPVIPPPYCAPKEHALIACRQVVHEALAVVPFQINFSFKLDLEKKCSTCLLKVMYVCSLTLSCILLFLTCLPHQVEDEQTRIVVTINRRNVSCFFGNQTFAQALLPQLIIPVRFQSRSQ